MCKSNFIKFWRSGENQSTRGKTSQSRGENQQTQLTYNETESRNRTWTTLVGGECSHHYNTTAPRIMVWWDTNKYKQHNNLSVNEEKIWGAWQWLQNWAQARHKNKALWFILFTFKLLSWKRIWTPVMIISSLFSKNDPGRQQIFYLCVHLCSFPNALMCNKLF